MNLKKPQKNGVTHVVLSPHELIEKLSALIPQPRMHLVRYSGVLAPNAKMRSVIIPGLTRAQIKEKEKQENKDSDENTSLKKSSPAKILARVFGIDVSKYTNCGGNRFLTGRETCQECNTWVFLRNFLHFYFPQSMQYLNSKGYQISMLGAGIEECKCRISNILCLNILLIISPMIVSVYYGIFEFVRLLGD